MRDWLTRLEGRTKKFAIDVIRLTEALEETRLPRRLLWQFCDAGTSVGANHRAARRARSNRELVSKLAVVDEEADESAFWLEVIVEVLPAGNLRHQADTLLTEACELRSIFSKGRKTSAGLPD